MQGYMGKGSGFRVNVLGVSRLRHFSLPIPAKKLRANEHRTQNASCSGLAPLGCLNKQIRFGVFYTRSTLWAALQICLTPKPRTLALFIPFPPCRLNSRDPGHDHPLRAEPLPCLPPQCLGMLMKLRIKASWFRI